jgi:hypothetical protein
VRWLGWCLDKPAHPDGRSLSGVGESKTREKIIMLVSENPQFTTAEQ